jgi:acetate kinase
MRCLLIINSGSSSVKFSLYTLENTIALILRGEITNIGTRKSQSHANMYDGAMLWREEITSASHAHALDSIFKNLEQHDHLSNITHIGHRIVHGGPYFSQTIKLTPAIESKLKKLTPLAPLHMPTNLDGIKASHAALPQAAQFACFDTSFHAALPKLAQYAGLPIEQDKDLIRRYGFHGLSCEYALLELQRRYGAKAAQQRIIIAHLGAGASITAVQNSKSVETTMGFTPLSGLPMASRSGDIDPGLLLYLLEEQKLDPKKLHDLLQNHAGLLGLSGQSGDFQKLTAPAADDAAKFAVHWFCYQARKSLGALMASMGGLDRLVFTGGIGENSAMARAEICDPLAKSFGLHIDIKKNQTNADSISHDTAPVRIEIIKADEAYIMAHHIVRAVSK